MGGHKFSHLLSNEWHLGIVSDRLQDDLRLLVGSSERVGAERGAHAPPLGALGDHDAPVEEDGEGLDLMEGNGRR